MRGPQDLNIEIESGQDPRSCDKMLLEILDQKYEKEGCQNAFLWD